VTVVRRLTDLVKELDLAVHTLSSYPEMNSSIKMEVGIEDSLHIEFEYNKSKYDNKKLNNVFLALLFNMNRFVLYL
jgi:vacuolar protein sorting-associated protein 26